MDAIPFTPLDLLHAGRQVCATANPRSKRTMKLDDYLKLSGVMQSRTVIPITRGRDSASA
jgi:hypothetical protein